VAALAKSCQETAEKLYAISLSSGRHTQEKGKNELYSTTVKFPVLP